MPSRLSLVIGAMLAFISPITNELQAQPDTRSNCERLYAPQYGQAGKDVIWIPTADDLVTQMLKMAKTTADDYVIDLGAGDGKIVIAAARDFGARALGIEYDLGMVAFANCMARAENVEDRAEIRQGDIFKEDFSQADVITLYLLDTLNLCIRHRLLAMAPGTRIASHSFAMRDWEPDAKVNPLSGTAYLWIVPARVGGKWSFIETGGTHQFDLHLDQSFQKIKGEAVVNGYGTPLHDAVLSGGDIGFSFKDNGNTTYTLTGKVETNKITAVVQTSDGRTTHVRGQMQGNPVIGSWARMAYGCEHHYR